MTMITTRNGSYIRECRIAAGLTQKQLGEACGYTGESAEVSVRRWESEKTPVPLDRLRRLAAALNVSIDSLVP